MKRYKFTPSKIYQTPSNMSNEDKRQLKEYTEFLKRHLNGSSKIDKIKDFIASKDLISSPVLG